MWYRLAKQLSGVSMGGGIQVKPPSNTQKAETPKQQQELEEKALRRIEETRRDPNHQTIEEKLGRNPNRDGNMGIPIPRGLGDISEVLPAAIEDHHPTTRYDGDPTTGGTFTETFFEDPNPKTRGRL